MERRRHARTPVNINALLIGKKAIPSGCRVINVSQQGMMLYCDANRRLATFKAGDNVDIHLTVQHAGEQKKLTIPSSIKHVAGNSIDVEFHHPDAILMDLIESYRTSDQHKLEASLGHNSVSGAKVTPITHTEYGNTQRQAHETAQALGQSASHKPYYLGLLTLITALCIITGGYMYTASIDNRIRALETISELQYGELSELEKLMFSTSLQEGRYASLETRVTALGDAFARLDDKLTLLFPESVATTDADRPASDPLTAASTQQTGKITADITATATTVMARQPSAKTPVSVNATGAAEDAAAESNTLSDNAVADTEETPPSRVKRVETAAVEFVAPVNATANVAELPETGRPASIPVEDHILPARGDGPWTINLLSSTDRAYVEWFAGRAKKRNLDVVVEEADVKGKHYWRLQIPGFDSAANARTHAEPLKQALGIKDVWIFKKK